LDNIFLKITRMTSYSTINNPKKVLKLQKSTQNQ